MQLRSRHPAVPAHPAPANHGAPGSKAATATVPSNSVGKRKRRLSLAATAPATLTLSQESSQSSGTTDLPHSGTPSDSLATSKRSLKRPATASLASTSAASIHRVTQQVKDAKAKKKFAAAAKKRKVKHVQQHAVSTSASAKAPIASRAKAAAKAKAAVIDIVPHHHHLLASPTPPPPQPSIAPAATDGHGVPGDDNPFNTTPTRTASRRLSSRLAQSATVPPPLPPPLALAAAAALADPASSSLSNTLSKKRNTPPSPGPDTLVHSVPADPPLPFPLAPSPRKKQRRHPDPPSVAANSRPTTPPNVPSSDHNDDDRMSVDTPAHTTTSSRPNTPMELDPVAPDPGPDGAAPPLPPLAPTKLRSALKKKPPTSTITAATPPISKRASPASASKLARKKPSATIKFRTRAIHFSSEPPQVFEVLGTDEYDRKVSDTDWWILFENNQVSHADAVRVYWELDMYKLYEMGPTLPPSTPVEPCSSSDPAAPPPDQDTLSTMRFDLVTTPAQRAALLHDLTYTQALALTLPEIQARLDSHLYEYDPGYQLAAPVLADLWDQLVEMVAPFSDILDLVSPPTLPDTPNPLGAFDLARAWAMWTHVVPDLCTLSLDQLYAHVQPKVPKLLLLDQIASLYLMHFVRPSRPPVEDERATFAKMVVMAVGGVRPQVPQPPPPQGRGKKAVRGKAKGEKAKASGKSKTGAKGAAAAGKGKNKAG